MTKIDEQTKQQRLERIRLLLGRHPRGLTEAEIAEELGFGRRTMNNYLRQLEYEGKTLKDGLYWYPLRLKESRLRPFNLSPEEAVALYLGTRLLAKQQDYRNEPAETALLKLAEVLQADAGIGDEIYQAALELANRPLKDGAPAIFQDVVRGYIYRKKIELTYRPLNSKRSFQTVFSTYLLEPSTIGFATYLIGHSSIPNAMRAYKLERIEAVRLTGEDYLIPNDFPGLDILQNSWNIVMGEDTVQVVLRFSPQVRERVLETNWHPSQEISEDPDKPGWLRWQVQVANTLDLVPWVRGWGADCEVLAPEGLRGEMSKHSIYLANMYDIPIQSTKGLVDRLLLLWGKTTQDVDVYHPALFHMLDVAHIAQQLLSNRTTPRWRNVLGQTLSCDPDSLQEWLPWFIALHDIGKISVSFQAQNQTQRQRLETEGFDFGRYSFEHKDLHHTIVGSMVLQEWAKTMLPRAWRTVFLDMISGHHGTYQQADTFQRQLFETVHEAGEWHLLRMQAISVLQSCLLLNKPSSWPEPKNISAAIVTLNGFSILCDWLGSDGNYFIPQPYTSILEYLPISRQNAQQRVADAGFFMPVSSAAPLSFMDLFSWPPRPLQAAIDNMPESILSKPTLTIIEAPTGEGKTEAALTLAHRIAHIQGTDEMYIALPTTATSNAMYKRLQAHLYEHLALPLDIVQLVHGQSFLVKDDLNITPLVNQNFSTHPALTWFEPKKKALLAPFGVGTVDQVELSALNVRHNALRLIGLAGKVVILDEVHAYDTYMTEIILRTLQWLAALGSSVVLLSATLPIRKRQQLIDAYTRGQVSIEKTDAYPYLLTVNDTDAYATNPPAQVKNKRIALHTLTMFEEKDWDGKAKWLLQQVEHGGCICWMTNTVERSQRLYQSLLVQAPEDVDCILLHARFPLSDRQAIEEQILAKYGKSAAARPEKGIAIGTQVLEQSLDIDFDLLVSDLAPIDLLLQRIGRLHRHNRPNRPLAHATPMVYIHYVLDEKGYLRIGADRFYTPYILHQSLQVIEERASGLGYLDLPSDYRLFIEAVYDETPPDSDSNLYAEWQERQKEEVKLSDEAKLRMTGAPDPRRQFWKRADITFREDEESADWMVAQTRYQERESISVIPLEKLDDTHCSLLDKGNIIALDQPASRQIQLDLLQHSVRLNRPEIVFALKNAERPVLFTESVLLKRCYPVWLENGAALFGNFRIQLNPQLGIVFDKKE